MKREIVNNELEALRDERDRLMKDINEKSKEFFNNNVKSLFEKYPKLKAFSWSQYTPYFNDGDPCYFRAHIDDPKLQYGDDAYIDDFYYSTTTWDSSLKKSVPIKNLDPILVEKQECQEAISSFLSIFESDDFEFMFGDHVEVTVTPDKVTVDEYDHD